MFCFNEMYFVKFHDVNTIKNLKLLEYISHLNRFKYILYLNSHIHGVNL